MINKYPYTDFHELNLDWFLEEFKKVTDKVTTLDETVQQFTDFVTNYFDNLDVQTEINNKLNQMRDDGTLAAIIQPMLDDFTAGITENITAFESQVNNQIDAQDNAIDVLEARMDSFTNLSVGSTTGDAELIDARIGANGITYTNAGDAIRALDTAAQLQIDRIEKGVMNNNNLLVDATKYVHGYYYTAGTETASANYDYYAVTLEAGVEYTVRGVRFISDTANIVANIGAPQYVATFTPATTQTYYISLSYAAGVNIHFVATTTDYAAGNYGTLEKPELASHIVKQGPGTSKTATMSQDAITREIASGASHSINLADPSSFTLNRYVGDDGTVGTSTTYFFTDYIFVEDYKSISFNKARFVTAYDSSLTVMPAAGISSPGINAVLYEIPVGVSYVIITGLMAEKDEFMVNEGQIALDFFPFGVVDLKSDVISWKKSGISYSAAGSFENRVDFISLSSGTSVNAGGPKYVKNGILLSAYGEFSGFNYFSIGKGVTDYRGAYFKITNTAVEYHRYEGGDNLIQSVGHGMNIQSFLQVAVKIGTDGTAKIVLNSLYGTNTVTIQTNFEMNGTPFLMVGQGTVNGYFTVSASQAKSPVWIMGDSYMGYTADRVAGQLQALGYAAPVMIDGLAGLGSQGAWNDLKAMIAGGNVPKILVWYIGMNDTDATYATYLTKLQEVCEQYGIVMVLNDTPTVPNVNNETKHGLVQSYAAAGGRIVNSYQSVGADSSGNWRAGFLSGDQVHPTALGAKALAAALLASVPEIMQY